MEEHVHRGYKYKKGYTRGCEECHRLARLEDKRSAMRKLNGTTRKRVPSKNARRDIKALLGKGYGISVIAQETGLRRESLDIILYKRRGEQSTVFESTQQALHDLLMRSNYAEARFERRRRRDHVSAELSRLAIQGLMLRGWSQVWIAEQIGTKQARISRICVGGQASVTRKMHDALVALARKYGTTDGPSNRARNMATRQGYISTAWTDALL